MKHFMQSLICVALVMTTAGAVTAAAPSAVSAQTQQDTQGYELNWETDTGKQMFTKPQIGPDGTIFLGVSNRGAQHSGYELAAFSRDGQHKWSYQTGADFLSLVPARHSDASALLGFSRYIVALDQEGKSKWMIEMDHSEIRQIAEGPDGTTYAATYDELIAITPEGDIKWDVTTPYGIPNSITVSEDGTTYFHVQTHEGVHVIRVAADGTMSTEHMIQLSDEGITSTVDATGKSYVALGAGVRVYQPDGTLLWEQKIDGINGYPLSAPFIDADGNIHAVSVNQDKQASTFYALNAQGELLWKIEKEGIFSNAPNYGPDGTVYASLVNENRRYIITAVGPDGETKWTMPESALADTPASGPNGQVAYVSVPNLISLTDLDLVPQPLTVSVNGAQVRFSDAQPYVNEDARTMVPLRSIAEQLGAQVAWQGAENTVLIDYGTQQISLKLGEKQALVNGKPVEFDTSAVIQDERTYVPLRFLSETFGATVNWNEKDNRIEIVKH